MNKNIGKKQARAQEMCLFILKSYQRIFLRVKPQVKNEVKVAKTPKSKTKTTIPLPKWVFNPVIASGVVSEPVIPKIRIVKKREIKAAKKVAKIITFLKFFGFSIRYSLISGITEKPAKEKRIAP